MKKAIIFDMDGTLWDSADNVAISWNIAMEKFGYEREPINEADMQSVMGKTMDKIAEILFDKVEGEENTYLFRCTEVQAINYFFKLARDVEILAPERTRDKFIQRYRDAYLQYVDQDETEEDGCFEAFDPAAILAEIGDEKKVPDESISDDELYVKALEIAFETGKVSTSLLQRRLLIGYGRAAHIVDKMEDEGVISAPNGCEPRLLLITKQEYQKR